MIIYYVDLAELYLSLTTKQQETIRTAYNPKIKEESYLKHLTRNKWSIAKLSEVKDYVDELYNGDYDSLCNAITPLREYILPTIARKDFLALYETKDTEYQTRALEAYPTLLTSKAKYLTWNTTFKLLYNLYNGSVNLLLGDLYYHTTQERSE